MKEQPPSLRERKKAETRARILEATRDLFEAQGYDETAIDQIAAQAQVSRGTLFNYFPTKESLLAAIGDEELRHLEALADGKLAALPTQVGRMRATMRTLVADTQPFLRVTRYVLLDTLQHLGGQNTTHTRLGRLLGRLVRQAQAEGEIRADMDPDTIAQAIVGAYLAAVIAASLEAPPAPRLQVENMVDMLFEGIAGPRYRRPEEA